MKNLAFILSVLISSGSLIGQSSEKLVSEISKISFYSSTKVEDIEAVNTGAVSTINKTTGEVVFSVPMQGFEFEKALMQKHYNGKKFLDTKTYPKSKLKAKIINNEQINYTTNGSYEAIVEGELTLKGVTNKIKEKGKVVVKDGKISVESKFDITLADYGVTFKSGKPSTNIAKVVQVKVIAEYK